MAKRTRITLTKAEIESKEGQRLINLILDLCHDGELTIAEVETLHAFLRQCQSGIAAIGFLRAITRGIVADGAVDPGEAYRLRRGFERVVPKEVRGVISTHLEHIGMPPFDDEDASASWRRHEATAAQIEFIVNLGGHPTATMTKGEASDLIDSLLERRPPTPRQVMLLRFFNCMQLQSKTKEEASVWIDSIFAEDGRRERAWDRFKLEHGISPFDTDPGLVPIGAAAQYLR